MTPKPEWLTEEEFLEAPDFDWSLVHDYVHEGGDE